MSDFICRNTMMRCNTPGMCSPHGGCQDPVNAQLRAVNFDYQLGADAAKDEIVRLKAENDRLRADYAALSTFNPDWDRVAAAQDSVREQMELANQANARCEELLSALKGMASMYGYCWDLVDGGLLCMQQNVQRFESAHEEAQRVITATSKASGQ